MNWFKKPKKQIHPVDKRPISYAFTIDGEDYYEYENLLDVPTMRYHRMQQFLVELDMRITREKLVEVMDKILEHADEGKLSKVIMLAMDIKNRAQFLIETETFYRLATCTFFTLEENTEDYDFDFNERKLNKFKEQKIGDFFFKKPVKKLIPQLNISVEDLEIYLKTTKAVENYEEQVLGLKNKMHTLNANTQS